MRPLVLCALSALLWTVSFGRAGSEETIGAQDLIGDYYYGDGLGVNCTLKLAQDGSFQFQWHGCLGMYDQNSGSYRVESGILILSPRRPNIRQGFQGTPTRFLPVTWGTRLYLVPDDEVLNFCNRVNEGMEPRHEVHGMVYLRQGDEKKAVKGFPSLPQTWRGYLLKRPITGRIIRVGKGGVVRVNVGVKDGLKVGMQLIDLSSWIFLDVTSVEGGTAEARVSIEGDKVRGGSTVSTHWPP